MGVSENSGTPKSSILIGFSIRNDPFWGTPVFGNTHMTPFFFHVVCWGRPCWEAKPPLGTLAKQRAVDSAEGGVLWRVS